MPISNLTTSVFLFFLYSSLSQKNKKTWTDHCQRDGSKYKLGLKYSPSPYVIRKTSYYSWLSLHFIILTRWVFISHPEIPEKRFHWASVVSLTQVAAGLFALLVESSYVFWLLKLFYLQPVMFCVDSANLDDKKYGHSVKYNQKYSEENVLGRDLNCWSTCFLRM